MPTVRICKSRLRIQDTWAEAKTTEKWIAINHCNSINRTVMALILLLVVWWMAELLTALSPKFRTLQLSFADCPTVAVTSRFVILSKNGSPYCVSHSGWASPLMISEAASRDLFNAGIVVKGFVLDGEFNQRKNSKECSRTKSNRFELEAIRVSFSVLDSTNI